MLILPGIGGGKAFSIEISDFRMVNVQYGGWKPPSPWNSWNEREKEKDRERERAWLRSR